MDEQKVAKQARATERINLKRLRFSQRIREEIRQAREQGNDEKARRLQGHLAWHNNQIRR